MKTIDNGKIDACIGCSSICGFRCCHQSNLHEEAFGPENAILLYPGEIDEVSRATRAHIQITNEDFNGGKLGYCDRENFDQSTCDPTKNFKPLDCRSYPFFPTIVNGELKLLIDKERCPLPSLILQRHYDDILKLWTDLLVQKPELENWIKGFNLQGYTEFNK
jgi:hypothetical protein